MIRVVSIGAGPAAILVMERFIARHARDTPELEVEYHLVDPHEPGGGRIWRRAQSPLLKLNSMREDVTMFTDDSCVIDGPVVPGPTLAEWVTAVRRGEIAKPDWSDATLDAEIADPNDRAFPTRRLGNAYLSWVYRDAVRRARPEVTVRWHEDVAIAVDPGPVDGTASGDAATAVRLASGRTLHADIVLYALGHNGSAPSAESTRLADFAGRHGVSYVAPAFTADIDLDWLAAGEDVIVRGMGLAAVDLTVLLTEGRGGRFVEQADGSLRYHPSGREPRLHLGSRRGVPYRSKITSRPVGDPVELEYLHPEGRERLLRSPHPLDFERDVWPLIASEMLTGYYRELFTGHPERVSADWSWFAPRLRRILAEDDGYRSRALIQLIEHTIPHPDDRLELEAFDRPLTVPGAGESVHERVHAHIEQDLRQRTRQEHSATQALFLTLLRTHIAVSDIPLERWNDRSRIHSLPRAWHTYFSYVASGPPGDRLRELLALSDAGIVHFLGGELRLEAVEDHGVFVARGTALTDQGERTASVQSRILIDAWLPAAQATGSDNPLLRQLLATDQVAELPGSGSVVVEQGRIGGSDGRFAIGPFTSEIQAGAFTRPGINALPLRRADHLAGALLRTAARSAAREPTGAAAHPVTLGGR